MGRLRKAIGIFAAVALGFVLLILLAFAAVQTQTAREWIAAQATRALSGDGATALVGGIEGTIPFDMRLSEIHLGDADGEFLAATNLALALAPRALLHGRIEITRLSADDIAVARIPQSKTPPTKPSNRQPIVLPHLPHGLVVDRIAIAAVRLAAPVLGEPVALSIAGATSLVGGEATAELAVRRIDGRPGRADRSP